LPDILHIRGSAAGRYQGFTLVELIACIVIIGVLAAVAGPRFFDFLPFQQRGYVDELAAAIRYAQRVAIASDCSVAFTVNATGYSATLQGGSGPAPACPSTIVPTRSDGTALSGSPPTGVTVTPATTSFTFLGTGAVSAAPATIVVGAFTLTVSSGSGLVIVQ